MDARRDDCMSEAPAKKLTYEYRPMSVDAAELRVVTDLFRAVFPDGGHLTLDYLTWLYRDNPSGHVIGVNAWHEGVLAGHYAVIPIRAAYRGQPVRATLSLNTATHPDHRGQGLFTTLADMTYAAAASAGLHHVIGVANANSTPGFLKKLKFVLVSPLDAKLCWLGPALREAPPGAPSWQRTWDAADLAWRAANPSTAYTVRRAGGTRQILSPTHLRGIQAVLKIDSTAAAAATPLPKLAARRVPGVRLWIGRSRRIRIPTGGGLPVPERYRKSPLNLIFRPLQNTTDAIDADTVEFEAIDFDAY